MRRLEGGDWKSTIQVTRWSPTLRSCPVLKTSGAGDSLAEFNWATQISGTNVVLGHL
jgi:hypothetical protein